MLTVEHPHVAREPLDPHRGSRLADHDVEQSVRLLDRALRLGGRFPAKLDRDVRQRPLEVRGQLPGVVT